MSVVGKGRGRGFTDVHDTPLRRPGQLNISKFNDLISLIDNLFIKDPISGKEIDKIVRMIENSLKNSSLIEVFDDLHKQALEDRQFGIKLAITCSDPKIYVLNDCNLRLILLQALQKDYEEREQIRKRSVIQFRNAISLLGGVYYNLKINSKPIDILCTPLLHYLESLLDASEEEDIELVTIQMCLNGSKIFEQSSPGLEDFLISVRQILVNRNLSAKSREMLLFIIDSSNQHFRPLIGKIKEFYFNKLDGNPILEIENHVNNILYSTRFANNVYDETGTKDNFVSASMKISEVELGYVANEKNSLNIITEKPLVPRAIRGAGAGDSIKDKNIKKSLRGKKDKVTDGQIWSSKPNTSSKVWGHDDRFDKDYTQT